MYFPLSVFTMIRKSGKYNHETPWLARCIFTAGILSLGFPGTEEHCGLHFTGATGVKRLPSLHRWLATSVWVHGCKSAAHMLRFLFFFFFFKVLWQEALWLQVLYYVLTSTPKAAWITYANHSDMLTEANKMYMPFKNLADLEML